MNVTAKCLIDAQYVPNAITTMYMAPALTRTIIDKFTVTNTDAGSQTVSVYFVPAGGSAGATTILLSAMSVSAGSTSDLSVLQNQILNPGDFIAVVASVANKIVQRASGREVA